MSYHRKQEDKRRLNQLADNTAHWWCCGAWYDPDKGCYVRYWKSKGKTCYWSWAKKYYRRMTRRIAQKTGRWERKEWDLWYDVY